MVKNIRHFAVAGAVGVALTAGLSWAKPCQNGVGSEGRWGFCSPNFPNSGGFSNGQTRHFQAIYREDVAGVCMSGQNTSQAVSVTFQL